MIKVCGPGRTGPLSVVKRRASAKFDGMRRDHDKHMELKLAPWGIQKERWLPWEGNWEMPPQCQMCGDLKLPRQVPQEI